MYPFRFCIQINTVKYVCVALLINQYLYMTRSNPLTTVLRRVAIPRCTCCLIWNQKYKLEVLSSRCKLHKFNAILQTESGSIDHDICAADTNLKVLKSCRPLLCMFCLCASVICVLTDCDIVETLSSCGNICVCDSFSPQLVVYL